MSGIKISDLPAAASALGAMQLEVNDAGTSRRVTADQVKTFATTGLVADTRQVATGTGLTGGGNLTADRTLALSESAQASLAKADMQVQVITSNTAAVISRHYFMNAAGLTVTLPGTPVVGDEIRFTETAGSADSQIARNGNLIMGDTQNLLFDTPFATISLRYANTALGWVIS
jgi:hypothetical protein